MIIEVTGDQAKCKPVATPGFDVGVDFVNGEGGGRKSKCFGHNSIKIILKINREGSE